MNTGVEARDGARLGSLTIQSVLYRHTLSDVERLVKGIGNAVRIAQKEVGLGPVQLLIGDCSPTSTLTLGQVDEIRSGEAASAIDQVSYDFFGENLGSAGGHNRLLAVNESDFTLFLNPDTFASPSLLTEMAIHHRDSRVGIVEARQVPLEHPKYFDPTWGDTSWASTAGCLVRRAVLDAVIGFDNDSFFLYCDDVDFSWRARLAGFRVLLEPAARLFHDKRLTTDGKMVVGNAEIYYAAEAALMLAWKYSRNDLVEEWLYGLAGSPIELQAQAAQNFERRYEEGSLPEQLDAEGRVAEFVGFNFARHRFSYDD